MAKKVVLEIIGTQQFSHEDRDSVELTTVGTLEETDDKYIIRYSEEQEPPRKAISAKLTIKKDFSVVEMLRSGDVGSLLIIERSKRNLCRYGTEYGDLLMGIYGKNIEATIGDTEGAFSFAYDIDINGALSSRNEVTIKYRLN